MQRLFCHFGRDNHLSILVKNWLKNKFAHCQYDANNWAKTEPRSPKVAVYTNNAFLCAENHFFVSHIRYRGYMGDVWGPGGHGPKSS